MAAPDLTLFFQPLTSGTSTEFEAVVEVVKHTPIPRVALLTQDNVGTPARGGLRDAALLGGEDSWGHIPIPRGVIHPGILGGAPVRVIPLLPLRGRRLESMPGGALMPGAVDAIYQELWVAQQAVLLCEQHPHASSEVHSAHARVQTYFEALCRALGPEALTSGRFCDSPRADFELELPPDEEWWSDLGAAATGCAHLGDRAVICEGKHAHLVDLGNGSLLQRIPVPPVPLLRANATHAVFWLEGEPIVLDLESRTFVRDPGTLELGVVVDGPGMMLLQDPRRDSGVTLVEVGTPPAAQATSPCGRYVWVVGRDDGAIYDTRTGLRICAQPALRAEARKTRGTASGLNPDGRIRAIALDQEDRWCLFEHGLVVVDNVTLGRVERGAQAAAFANDGSALLLVYPRRIVLVRLTEGLPRSSYPRH